MTEEWLTTEEVLSYLMEEYDLTRDDAEAALDMLIGACPEECMRVEH